MNLRMQYALAAAIAALSSPGSAAAAGSGSVEGNLDLGKGPILVYVESVATRLDPPAAPAVMNQKNNTYVPHILPIQSGQKVEFRSADPELHNLYAVHKEQKKTLFNVALPPRAPPTVQSFPPSGAVKLTCNVHSEMLAWIVVLQNPHYVLLEKGAKTFRIDGLPPGHLTLRVWGEKLEDGAGKRKFEVDVVEGAVAHADLSGAKS